MTSGLRTEDRPWQLFKLSTELNCSISGSWIWLQFSDWNFCEFVNDCLVLAAQKIKSFKDLWHHLFTAILIDKGIALRGDWITYLLQCVLRVKMSFYGDSMTNIRYRPTNTLLLTIYTHTTVYTHWDEKWEAKAGAFTSFLVTFSARKDRKMPFWRSFFESLVTSGNSDRLRMAFTFTTMAIVVTWLTHSKSFRSFMMRLECVRQANVRVFALTYFFDIFLENLEA